MLRRLALLAAVAWALALAACPATTRTCPSSFIGDPAASPTVSFVVRDASGQPAAVASTGAVPLFAQPPGEDIYLYAGMRATNLDPCGVSVLASLLDTSGGLIGADLRPVILADDGSGYGVPYHSERLSNWSNVIACPSPDATRPVIGSNYRLVFAWADKNGRSGTSEITVVPYCDPSAGASCAQLCRTTSAGVSGGGDGNE